MGGWLRTTRSSDTPLRRRACKLAGSGVPIGQYILAELSRPGSAWGTTSITPTRPWTLRLAPIGWDGWKTLADPLLPPTRRYRGCRTDGFATLAAAWRCSDVLRAFGNCPPQTRHGRQPRRRISTHLRLFPFFFRLLFGSYR